MGWTFVPEKWIGLTVSKGGTSMLNLDRKDTGFHVCDVSCERAFYSAIPSKP